MSLLDLEEQIRRDLQLTRYPERDWMSARKTKEGAHIYDVLLVGGGQSGLAAAAALKRERVTNVLVVDANPAQTPGPWLTFARMPTLRTPKYVTGPDLGVPSLTLQSWYEAQHGVDAWENLTYVPKDDWAAYLLWYRTVLALPTRSETTAGALKWLEDEKCFSVPTSSPNGDETLFARRVVLTTGIEGSGHWHTPSFITDHVRPQHFAHTRDDIDFTSLKGKRVGVLGAGASAFDNASLALENGADEVKLFFRREKLVNVNPYRWCEFVGFLHHVGDLPDVDKWRFIRQVIRMGQLPPTDTLERAQANAGFKMHPSTPWIAARSEGDHVVVETPNENFEFDFIIAATGFRTDLSKRPELVHLYSQIALWADRHSPAGDDKHDDMLRHPYLGSSFEMTEKTPGDAPYLQYVYNYTFGCLPSLGFGGASISGMKYSIPRLVGGITRSFFVEDKDAHFAGLCAFDLKEF